MIQFYAPEIEKTLSLSPEEVHHCIKVLRRREGDIIYATDGKGKRYECRIVSADTRKFQLEIIGEERVKKCWNYSITLAVAPTKNADRMSWLVEKATEIGVDKIQFLCCQNSERRSINIERLRRNAISAMNQSLKTYLPELSPTESIDSICREGSEKYFGYCDNNTERKEFVREYKGGDVVIAIGPEGDFSLNEVEMLVASGFKPISFGEERLRTETAALYGVSAVHILNQLEK